MKIRKYFVIFLMGAGIYPVFSQQDSVYKFSLSDAIAFALENNHEVKNANLDVESAKKTIMETTAKGLPHVDATGSYQYILTIPDLFEQFLLGELAGDSTFIMAPPGEKQRIIDERLEDIRASTSVDLTVSQLVFSGSYIVGLQTAKVYKELSKYSLETTLNNVKENIINTYFLVLIARENVATIDTLSGNTEQLFKETLALYEKGFVEKTDAEQIELALETVKSMKNSLHRQVKLAE